MQYRALGSTGLRVSAVGLGCGQLTSSETEYAVRLVRRALELGVTYFDTARLYGDSEVKLGIALEGERQNVVVSSKTIAPTRDDAWRQINESLERLRTDYLDNCHLHGVTSIADLDRRMGPGGALAALIQAKEQGLIRHIGCTSHLSDVLVEAIGRFDFEIVLVPLNVIERDPLARLIPHCQEKGIAVTIMKPLATGLLPAELALRWLLNQPVATIVPGATTLAEVEANSLLGHRDFSLTPNDLIQAQALRDGFEHVRCRICNRCLPCPQGIEVADILGTDMLYDHFRTMGREAFATFPWSRLAAERGLAERQRRIPAIESCTNCGECEARCPHGLPIVKMLKETLPAMREIADIYAARLPGLH